MGEFFGTVQLPDWTKVNSLFGPDQNTILHNQALASNFAPGAADLANQTTQQNLVDRGSLRSLAPGLASADPSIRMNALASAAVLPGIGGVNSINALSEDAARTATSKLALLQYGNTLPVLPYGGGQTNSLISPAPGQGQGASPSFLDQMSGRESGGSPAVMNRQGYSGNFQFGTGRLSDLGMYQPAQGENPNGNQWHGTFNIPGFPDVQTHGQFLANPDAQRMAAEIHFKDIGNQIDNTPGAQDYDRAGLMAVAQLGGVQGMQKFIATGGRYNPQDSNGTHLSDYYDKFAQGGPAAFVGTFGHPSGPLPPTHPARQQVASNVGTAGMQQTATDASPAPMPVAGTDAGVPAGSTQPSTPQQVNDLLNSFRSNQAKGIAQADDGSGVAVDPSYLANKNTPAPGVSLTSSEAVAQANAELGGRLTGVDPKTANDMVQQRALQLMNASMVGAPAPALDGAPASGGQPVRLPSGGGIGDRSVSQALPSAPQVGPAGTPGQPQNALFSSPPVVQPQNALLQSAASPAPTAAVPGGISAAQGAPNQPPRAVATQAPFDPMAGLPPGSKPITVGPARVPYTKDAPAGFAVAQAPDGSTHFYPLVQPALKYEKTPNEIIGMDPRTGAIVSRQPITETGRQTLVPTADGNQVWMNGHPTGETIPYGGRPEQNEAYKADQKTAAGISASGMAAQGVMPRLNEMAQLGAGLQTGLGGEFRSKMQAVLEQLGANPADAAKLTGISSAADADEYRKLAISTAGTAAKADLGANNGVEAMRIYQSANPGMNLQPDANKRITNMLRVQQQSIQDYAQAAQQHFGDNEDRFLKGGNYAPLTAFNRQWQAQANPQVYAAATGILNGDPYAKWADKLSNPADAMRAASIAARIDPNVMVPIAGGKTQPARALLGGGR